MYKLSAFELDRLFWMNAHVGTPMGILYSAPELEEVKDIVYPIAIMNMVTHIGHFNGRSYLFTFPFKDDAAAAEHAALHRENGMATALPVLWELCRRPFPKRLEVGAGHQRGLKDRDFSRLLDLFIEERIYSLIGKTNPTQDTDWWIGAFCGDVFLMGADSQYIPFSLLSTLSEINKLHDVHGVRALIGHLRGMEPRQWADSPAYHAALKWIAESELKREEVPVEPKKRNPPKPKLPPEPALLPRYQEVLAKMREAGGTIKGPKDSVTFGPERLFEGARLCVMPIEMAAAVWLVIKEEITMAQAGRLTGRTGTRVSQLIAKSNRVNNWYLRRDELAQLKAYADGLKLTTFSGWDITPMMWDPTDIRHCYDGSGKRIYLNHRETETIFSQVLPVVTTTPEEWYVAAAVDDYGLVLALGVRRKVEDPNETFRLFSMDAEMDKLGLMERIHEYLRGLAPLE
ncbi:hypothetical protein [Xanthomonas phage RTH11]|nr:hypothetical protein [Xanthomonas phage RTH11]